MPLLPFFKYFHKPWIADILTFLVTSSMITSQKSQNKDLREKAKNYDKLTYEEMRKAGKEIQEQKDVNGSFYRSQKGANTTSIGMSGVLNSGDYGYVAKKQINSRSRLLSAASASQASLSARY